MIKGRSFLAVKHDKILVPIPGDIGHGFLVCTKSNAVTGHLRIGLPFLAIHHHMGGRLGLAKLGHRINNAFITGREKGIPVLDLRVGLAGHTVDHHHKLAVPFGRAGPCLAAWRGHQTPHGVASRPYFVADDHLPLLIASHIDHFPILAGRHLQHVPRNEFPRLLGDRLLAGQCQNALFPRAFLGNEGKEISAIPLGFATHPHR